MAMILLASNNNHSKTCRPLWNARNTLVIAMARRPEVTLPGAKKP